MARNVENLSLNMVGLLAEDEKQYYVDEHIYIAMNAQDFGLKHLRRDQPYRVDEGRVMMVTQGWVRSGSTATPSRKLRCCYDTATSPSGKLPSA